MAGKKKTSSSAYTTRWRLKRLEAGLCQWCGAPRCPESKRYCLLHLLWHRRLMRENWNAKRSQYRRSRREAEARGAD